MSADASGWLVSPLAASAGAVPSASAEASCAASTAVSASGAAASTSASALPCSSPAGSPAGGSSTCVGASAWTDGCSVGDAFNSSADDSSVGGALASSAGKAGGGAGRWARRMRAASRNTVPENSVIVFMLMGRPFAGGCFVNPSS